MASGGRRGPRWPGSGGHTSDTRRGAGTYIAMAIKSELGPPPSALLGSRRASTPVASLSTSLPDLFEVASNLTLLLPLASAIANQFTTSSARLRCVKA